jgi:hypothetical protein
MAALPSYHPVPVAGNTPVPGDPTQHNVAVGGSTTTCATVDGTKDSVPGLAGTKTIINSNN